MSDIRPSNTAVMNEDELGEALRRLREQARRADRDELDQIQKLRGDINRRLDMFIGLHMDSIDRDPRVREVIQQLATLTVQVSNAVKEMRTVRSAIQQATRIIGLVDQVLRLLGRAAV